MMQPVLICLVFTFFFIAKYLLEWRVILCFLFREDENDAKYEAESLWLSDQLIWQ